MQFKKTTVHSDPIIFTSDSRQRNICFLGQYFCTSILSLCLEMFDSQSFGIKINEVK